MKAEHHTRQLTMLDGEEASLRDRLLALLPGVATGGAQLFLNSMNSPEKAARYSHQEGEERSVSGLEGREAQFPSGPRY